MYVLSAGQGKIITLEIEDFEMEPEKDFLLIRDGEDANAPVLASLTGKNIKQNFISTTGNKLYFYTKTDQADSRKGYRIRYYEGCDAIITQRNGTVHSPAFGSSAYPTNQECVLRVQDPMGGKISLKFTDMDIHASDVVQVGETIMYIKRKCQNFLWEVRHNFRLNRDSVVNPGLKQTNKHHVSGQIIYNVSFGFSHITVFPVAFPGK